MPFILVYHPSVAEEDVPLLPLNVHCRIAPAIEARLVSLLSNMPLKGTFKRY